MQYQCNCGVYYDPASYDKGDLYYLFYSCPTCREKKRITEKSKYVLFCFSGERMSLIGSRRKCRSPED